MTHGAKPVLKERWQRKQRGQRKAERKQPRMNDGDNDEFSAAKTTWEGAGEEAWRGSVWTVCTYMYIYATCICVRMTEVDCEIQRNTEERRKRKIRGHRVKTGSQPNQFSLVESSCTISHQSTFFTLSALPSIHRGRPLCTLLRKKTEREGDTEK